jgi:hypothetical protein
MSGLSNVGINISMPKKKYIVKDYVVVAYHTMCQTLE